MPMIDMPVKELEKYNGVNPKPVDFEEYWDKAIAEMKSVNPQVVMTKSEFQAPTVECYDMYFTGLNAASGIAVFAMDVRGQGGKSEDVGSVHGNTLHGHIIRELEEDDPHKLLFRDIFLDTAELAGIVMGLDYIDEPKVFAIGGSQGGAVTIASATLEPRIAKAAPSYPFLRDYKRVWDMDLDIQAYSELKEWFQNFDPRHEREQETFTKLGYIDLQYLAPCIKAEVLMFTGIMDNVCPPSTQYAAYNKMTCKKKHILYPDYGHEWLREADDIIYDFWVNDKF